MSETQPSNNPRGADNEQGSSTATDLAWLAGHFDGDGWIGLTRQVRKNSRHIRYSAGAMIVTTSDRITDRVVGILEAEGITYFCAEVAPKIGSDGSPRKRKWNIVIRSNSQSQAFLKLIRPYLVEKGTCADIVIAYTEWRGQHPQSPGRYGDAFSQEIQERAVEAIRLLREDRERITPQRLHA